MGTGAPRFKSRRKDSPRRARRFGVLGGEAASQHLRAEDAEVRLCLMRLRREALPLLRVLRALRGEPNSRSAALLPAALRHARSRVAWSLVSVRGGSFAP